MKSKLTQNLLDNRNFSDPLEQSFRVLHDQSDGGKIHELVMQRCCDLNLMALKNKAMKNPYLTQIYLII